MKGEGQRSGSHGGVGGSGETEKGGLANEMGQSEGLPARKRDENTYQMILY